MSKAREESLESYQEWCEIWYGEDCYVYEEYGYMVISNGYLDVYQVLSCRDDGWLFCGELHSGEYIFTWEGE